MYMDDVAADFPDLRIILAGDPRGDTAEGAEGECAAAAGDLNFRGASRAAGIQEKAGVMGSIGMVSVLRSGMLMPPRTVPRSILTQRSAIAG